MLGNMRMWMGMCERAWEQASRNYVHLVIHGYENKELW